MMRILVAILLLASSAVRAGDKETITELSKAVGALSSACILDTYLALAHAEQALSKGNQEAVTLHLVIRHLSAMTILTKEHKKLRGVFQDDPSVIVFLDQCKKATDAIERLGDALLAYVGPRQASSLEEIKKYKEEVRAIIVPLMGLPDDREKLP